MNPNEQNPTGSEQNRYGQSSSNPYEQSRSYSTDTGTRYSGSEHADDESSWMNGKVGLYSALAAGSIGAVAYLLMNRESREQAGEYLREGRQRAGAYVREGMDTLKEKAERRRQRLSEERESEELLARDVMTDSPAVCTPDTKLQKVAAIMEDCDCGAIPVVDSKSNRRAIGIATDRDIVIRTLARGRNPMEMTVRECMTTEIVAVRPDATLEEVEQKMQDHQVRRVLVVDRSGKCRGIISQADLARHASKREIGETVREVSQSGLSGAVSSWFR